MLLQKIILLTVIVLLIAGSSNAVEYGEAYLVDGTDYDVQHNSTVGKMIARDVIGGTHMVWTNMDNVDHFMWRYIKYAFCDDDSGDIDEQLRVNQYPITRSGGSMVSLDLAYFEERILPACFFYGDSGATVAIDLFRGAGAYEAIYLGRNTPVTFPKGCVGRNLNLYVAALNVERLENYDLQIWNLIYEPDLFDWEISDPMEIEPVATVFHRVQASRNDELISLAWYRNLVGVPAPDDWDRNAAAHQMNNDLYVYESPDGDEWEFEDSWNITRTIPANPESDYPYSYGDTLRPYNDVDMIYLDDVVHVVFTTRGFKPDPEGEEEPPVESITFKESLIWHWDSESDTLTLVANGWYANQGDINSRNCNADRPSLGLGEDGILYCIFRQVTEDDLDADGFCAGEIMLSVSSDSGATWSEPVNLTGTVNGGEDGVEYHNENYPSLAELVDDDLHIFYMVSPHEVSMESQHRMVYHRVPVDDLPEVEPLEMPRERFQYHNDPLQFVDDTSPLIPSTLALSAYPNPFNSSTRLTYSVTQPGPVTLKLFDIAGREVKVLTSGIHEAGNYGYILDVGDLVNGIYLVEITNSHNRSIKKIALLK